MAFDLRFRWLALPIIIFVVGPKIAAYSTLWLRGVLTYRLTRSDALSAGNASRPVIAGLAFLAGAPLLYGAVKLFYTPDRTMYSPFNFDPPVIKAWLYYNMVGGRICVDDFGGERPGAQAQADLRPCRKTDKMGRRRHIPPYV